MQQREWDNKLMDEENGGDMNTSQDKV